MQSNIEHTKEQDVIIDFEFEISGERFAELEWKDLVTLKPQNHEVAISIEKTLMKNFWEIVSLEELKTKLHKSLNFLDLVKIKLDFGEKPTFTNPSRFYGNTTYMNTVFNAIEEVPKTFSNKLFGWVYYNDKNDKLETFRFTINIDNGEIKYFD